MRNANLEFPFDREYVLAELGLEDHPDMLYDAYVGSFPQYEEGIWLLEYFKELFPEVPDRALFYIDVDAFKYDLEAEGYVFLVDKEAREVHVFQPV